MKKTPSLLFLLILVFGNCFSQQKQNPIQGFQSPLNTKAISNSSNLLTPTNGSKNKGRVETYFNHFLHKLNGSLTKEQLHDSLNSFFNLGSSHSFSVTDVRKDNQEFEHINFQQLYKNIPVDGFLTVGHFKNKLATSISGEVATFSNLDVNPVISSDESFDIAKKYLKVKDKSLTEYPIILLITEIEKENSSTYKLAYKVRIDAINPFMMCEVFIDANSGEILKRINLIADFDTPGTGQTLYAGSQPITVDNTGSGFRLRESGRKIETYDATSATYTAGVGFSGYADITSVSSNFAGAPYLSQISISAIASSWWYASVVDVLPDLYIKIKDGSNTVVYNSGYISDANPPVTFYPNVLLNNPPYTVELWDYDFGSGDDYGGTYSISNTIGTQNYSGAGNNGNYIVSSLSNPALDVHWGMEKTFDFYQSVFGRNSYDGAGSTIKNFVNGMVQVAGNQNNACALAPPVNCMVYGMGDGTLFKPLVGLDVEGHEFSHMVIRYNGTGGLTYLSESGALNESFADIFGTCVEFYSGISPDWNIGEDVMVSAPFLRSLSNPNAANQPDTYQGNFWQNPANTSQDQGGVHTNSGVQNYWFYLLSQGGSGTNDLGNAYSVIGIGINQARQIAYRNLTTYLTPNSTFYSAYLGALQSAEDLYGNPSTQYTSVKNAWYAVGIGAGGNYCGGTTYLTAPSGSFSDGSGGSNYNSNSKCKWIINPPGATQISLNFTSFNTETNYDTVFVYNGPDQTFPLLATWWGNTLPPTLTTSAGNGAMCVRFSSDNTLNYPGWSANYTSVGVTPSCGGGQILSSPSGSFNDGSGAGNYGNNQICYWLIAPPCAGNITLSFSSFNTELNYDGIIVYDGNNTGAPQLGVFTGTNIPSSVSSTGGEMLVIFVSDYSFSMQGFNANYTSTGSGYCSGTTILNSNDNGSLSDGSGGNNYCNNQNCSWLIQPPQATSISLKFNSFDLENPSPDAQTIYDGVEIYDGPNTSFPLLGKFSGKNIPPVLTSTGGSMFLKFYSDVSVNAQGWGADYTSTSNTYCTGLTNLTAASGNFDDGSAVDLYANNSYCSWLIQPPGASSITLAFSSFDIELNNDAVIVYDGPNNTSPVLGTFSGATLPSMLTSAGSSMYVEFLSNSTNRGNGWAANYSSLFAGINELSSSTYISVFPNPANKTIKILNSGYNFENASLEVLNNIGQVVILSKYKEEIDVQSLSQGIYTLKITSQNGQVFLSKFLKD